MQPTRVFIRAPAVCRVAKAPIAQRSMSLFSPTPFYPRFVPNPLLPSISHELAPFFRLVDEFTARTFDHIAPAAPRPFQPRFDVQEGSEQYELRGELPGLESSNLDVEFTDAQTLVIRGHIDQSSTSGTNSDVEFSDPTQQTTSQTVADNTDAQSTHSDSSYHKATVEDESVADSSTATPAQATPAESNVSEMIKSQRVDPSASDKQPKTQSPRIWISERSTGSFQRVFNFPGRIDQDGVTASLKNGILNITVPKAAAPTSRRININ